MKRLLPFIFLIILLLAGVFSIPYLLRPESHRAHITDTLSKLLKRPVVIGQITMTYWPPTLRLGQTAVLGEGDKPVLQIESAVMPLDWTSLFHLQFVPTDLELDHWTLTTQRKADGSWDLEDWLSRASGFSASKTWPVGHVSWKEGEMHWVDRYAGVPQEIVLGSVQGSWDPKEDAIKTDGAFSGIGSPARFSFAAKGQFFSQPQWSGDLQLTEESNTCTFHIDKKPDALDVKGSAAKWRLANALMLVKFYARGAATRVDGSSPLMLENWQTHMAKAAGRGSFAQAADISGGASEVKGTIETKDSGFLVHADVALRDVPAQAVWNALGETISLDGKVTAMAKDVELTLSTQPLSTLQGVGGWELKDGHYKVPPVSLQKLAKAKTMAYMKKKFPDLENSGIPVTRLSAHWQAKNGILTIDDGLLVSTDLKAGWVGKLDAARQGMDAWVRLQIREKDPKLSHLIPAKYQGGSAYGRLQGTWQEWVLRSVPASKIPAATQTKLRQAISQK